MKVSLISSLAGDVILVRADKRLDLLAYGCIDEVAELAEKNPSSEAIIIDLGGTRELFDSGKATLLAMRERAGRLKSRIYLANLTLEMKRKLSQGKFPILFNIIGHGK